MVAPVYTRRSIGGFRFAVYPRRGGRTPELDDPKALEWIGRFIGRIHAVGAARPFEHRAALDAEDASATTPRAFLLASDFVPADLLEAWKAVTEQALAGVDAASSVAGTYKPIRLHGDCHAGNMLWTDDGPHFVDLDDARMGPAMQDLWMLLSGDRAAMARQLRDVLAGYEEFREFDRRELHPARGAAHAAPASTTRPGSRGAGTIRRFPPRFPWFNTQRYWQDRILELREQIALMEEEPLNPA